MAPAVFLALLAVVFTGIAGAVPTERVSIAHDETEAVGASTAGALSGNGSSVAFESGAGNLVPFDTNSLSDVFVRLRATGDTQRVSVDTDGGDANAFSGAPDISGDGAKVVFESSASDLIAGDENEGVQDIFLRTLGPSPTTTLVSIDSTGGGADNVSHRPRISGNGQFVSFLSVAPDLVADDPNADGRDLFVRDLTAGVTERIPVPGEPSVDAFHPNALHDITPDGRYVVFALQTDGLLGDANFVSDIFTYDRELETFERISNGLAGEPDDESSAPSISHDGRYVVFQSFATNLVEGDDNEAEDVFLYDRTTDETTRISTTRARDAFISGSGRFVTYGRERLLSPNTWDVYLYDRSTGITTLESVDSDGGEANGSSDPLDVDTNGGTILFKSTADDLAAGDTNDVTDLFVRNVDEAHPTAPGPFVVNTTNDAADAAGCTFSHCSLREAILAANAAVGLDEIHFRIAGAEVQTITPLTVLPTITDSVTIDGYTQPGASENTLATGNDANLLVELNGNDGLFDGLVVTSGGTTITGLVINNFRGDAIELRTNGNNLIAGNFIGTNAAGTALLTSGSGIYMENSPDNRIGGDTPAARNVIANSANASIRTPGACTGCPVDTGGGNIIQGNYIGTDKSGTAHIATPPAGRGGIYLSNANNLIGGTTAGARNVMSTVGVGGITLGESDAHHNVIQGNYIGVDSSGGAQLAPGWGVVAITLTRTHDNQIGGTDAGARNVIASASGGINIFGVSGPATPANNVIQGNFIGTDATGSVGMPVSAGSAVTIDSSAGNTIGGSAAGAGNVLSRSLRGVNILTQLPVAADNVVQGNFIGTNATGTAGLGNSSGGVVVASSGVLPANYSNNNTIGGTSAGARNIISANTGNGVWIASGNNTAIQGNYIGVTADGATALGNSDDGVDIGSGTDNVVGGSATGAGNLISGNVNPGVDVGSGATGTRIEGNLIGTNAAGTGALGNGQGVRVQNAANTDIGGATTAERNVIAASTNGAGIFVSGAGATGVTVQGNYIGTNADGTAALGNKNSGVSVNSNAVVQIGGTATGAGNVISANGDPTQPGSANGIHLASANNVVQGNLIGTDATGTQDLGNALRGILVQGNGNTIGGSTPAARNVVSGAQSGVHISSGTQNVVSGNYIGTNAAGTAAIGNDGFGIQINSDGNTVGGATAAAGNLISGNGSGRGNGGVVINGGSNVVEHNLIGTTASGTGDLGNNGSGVLVMANFGTPTSGVANRIARNVIAFNGSAVPLTSAGVDISAGSRNAISENSIFSNDTLGIDLGWDGVTSNDSGDTDTGANGLQNFPELSSATVVGEQTEIEGVMRGGPSLLNMVVEFFSSPVCDGSGNGEGQTYLGSHTIQDQSGADYSFAFTHSAALPAGHVVTATATTESGDTSEFSACRAVAADSAQSGPTFTVNSIADATPDGCTQDNCTLREAINAANAAAGANSIHFDIGAGGAATIHPTSALPTLTGPATVDGTTQAGFDGDPMIELDGSLAGGPGVQGLSLGDDVTVRGLVINDFSGHGIVIGSGSSGNKVEGSYIGTDLSGAVDRGNGLYGIVVSGASNTTIGGTTPAARNVISGNPNGITVGGNSTGTTIAGNYIGTNAAGTGAVGNAYGIQVDTSTNTLVGGTAPGAGNVISGNVNGGIITTGTNTGTKIQGNYVGTNAAGSGALANGLGGGVSLSGGSGILVAGNVISGNSAHGLVLSAPAAGATIQGNFVGTKADGTGDLGNAREGIRIEGGSGTTVGGTTPAARNVVSGNNGHGILLYGATSTTVQGNYAGTDVTGTIGIPNGIDGIGVDGGSNNTIGGTVAGAGNLASGNTNQGIAIFGVDFPSTTGNTVLGNKVGTKIDGTSPLGNGGDGIRMHNAANTTVGGEAEGGQNRVAHNAGDGVVVFGTGSGNEIRRNSIVSNGDLGIDLGANGITANDAGDTDAGPNGFQNFPVLTSATKETGGVRIQGTLSSAANTGYSLDYYASSSCDGSGNGEGDRWLGWSHISTNADGHLTFDTGNGLTASVNVGDAVTATATAPDGSTSEFSLCRSVTEASTPASATITLDSDQTSVIAGAQSVPTGGIDLADLHATRGGTTESAPLDAIPLDAIPLDAIPLDAIPLDAIGFTSTMLQDALGGVHLDEIPISTPPGGWAALLVGTPLEGVPLNTITLADVYAHNESAPGSPNAIPLDAIPLDAIDLSATPLDAIPLGAIALGATPLDAIPLDAIGTNDAAENAADWCAVINSIEGYSCPPLDPSTETLIGIAVKGIPLDAIPLDAIPLDAIPLDAIPLDAIPLDAIPLDAIPLDAIPLDAIPLDAIPLDAIDFAVSPLDAIPLDAIGAGIIDCSGGYCTPPPDRTLGEAAADGRILTNATLFDLIGALLPGHGASVADLIYGLPTPPHLTLGDLFALVLGGEGAYDWGNLDLDTFPVALYSPDGGVITYRATVQVTGGAASNVATIRAALPDGGFYKTGSTQLVETDTETVVELDEPTVGRSMLTWAANVQEGVQYQLTWQVHAPIELGNYPITANVIVDGMESPDQTGPVSVAVTQTLEPNDNLGAGQSLEGDTLYLGYMLQGDVDRHVIDIPTAFGSVVKIKLTHIAEGTDLDLTVAGPPAPTLRAAPLDAIPLQNAQLPDTEVDLDQRSQPLPPENLQDVPTNVIATDPNVIRGVSDNRGNADEEVTLISQGETGEYIVQVSDYEGDSPMPYMLEVDVQGPPALGACSPRSFAHAGEGVVGATPTSVPANTNTLILVNQKRLGDTYGATAASNVMTKLNELAGRSDLGIIGAVVPVDQAAGGAYAAWDANPCSPALANDVVREIGQLVDGLEPANLQYKVIVGGDDQLPFGRVPDETLIANESSYTTSLTGPNNQYKGAFGNSMLMTDDVYAEEGAPQLFGHELFVPDQAVGRLVETPGEITGMIDAFLAVDGALTPQRSLTTGYDFLTDGAEAVNAPFNAAFAANARTLINENWAARDPATAPNNLPDDLEDALFPAAPTLPPQLNSINAHFDHSRLLPAAENAANRATNLYTAQDVRDRGAAAVAARVLFSMGCHSGLAVSDEIYTGGSAVAKDWSQTFLAGGAFAWIGNNGFGLGDTVDVAYTERLHALLTGNLDGSLTLGEALAQAKQDYLSTLAIVGGYDAKVVMQTTLFGLPMLEVGTGAPPANPAPLPTETDPATGLAAASFTKTEGPDFDFTRVENDEYGDFFRADSTQATNRRPIEPVVSFDVTQPGKVAHGIVITHLESLPDEPDFDAAFSRVVNDKSEDEPELVGEASHPAKIQSLSTFSSFSSPAVTRQNAVLVAGLYRSDGVPDPLGVGIHRLYSEIGGYVLYAAPSETDFTPPELGPLDAQVIGSGVGFAVDVTDADGTVEDVKVIYRDCAGNWHLSTLQSSGGDRWSGGGPPAGACDEIDYYLQAVDDAGNVAVSSKKVQIKPLDLPDPTGDTDIDFTLSGTLHASGWYTSAVGVTIEADPASDLEYSLDGNPFQPYTATFSVSDTGVHFVEARAEDGSTNTVGFAIDMSDPVVLMTTPPAGAVYEQGQVVHADFTCADSGSGPASCTGTPPNGTPLDTTSVGTKTITVDATDKVGNSTTFQRTYEVVLRRILFASSRTGFGDIYAISPSGGEPARLTDSNAIDAEPEWFPGNERIVFSSSRTGNGDIYAMDDDGTNLDQLTSHAGIDTSPAVSPDGSKIAFASNRESRNWDIYVMNANGSNVQRLTTDKNQDLLPAWSPDGTQIAFMSTRTAKGDIYKMNANGTSQTRLTSGSTANGIDTEPAWFGSTIAFSTNRHGDSNFEIYTMTPTGASQTRRTQQPGHDITPAWSGDGAKLAFATNRSPGGGLNFNIYTMNPDGSAQTALVTHGAADVFPDW